MWREARAEAQGQGGSFLFLRQKVFDFSQTIHGPELWDQKLWDRTKC